MTHRDNRQERSFGLCIGAVCGLLALLTAWRGHPVAPWILGNLSLWLIGLGWLRPSTLHIPSRFWWRLAHALGWINTRVLLTFCFFTVVTPTGVILRRCGWDSLHRRRAGRGSGWVPHPDRHRDPKHYERMY
ncbi:MAG: SxtJ family membrane protein [Candidatus Omnitrophota bacterium]|nr:SxtJ family membrane protein [Candidatus Omnitrophota bacterium]